MKVVVRPAARRDFHNQVAWLSEQSPKAGRAAALRLVEAIDLLKDYPLIGHTIESGLREKLVGFGQYGFVIRYRLERGVVSITRIFHASQDR